MPGLHVGIPVLCGNRSANLHENVQFLKSLVPSCAISFDETIDFPPFLERQRHLWPRSFHALRGCEPLANGYRYRRWAYPAMAGQRGLPALSGRSCWGGCCMRVNILGAPELLGAERPVKVSPQLWCVLLSLIVVPGVPVTLDALVDRLWGDDPSAKSRSTARSYLHRVERALSEAAGREVRAERRARGYALEISRQDVDLHRFRDQLRRAEEQAGRGDLVLAIRLMKQAESLWRGEVLAGLSSEWIGRMRAALNEELQSAVGRRVELELTLGRHGELLGELADLTERYPSDESFTAQRMLALFRAGRHADAIRVSHQIRARLIEEGLEASPHIEDLYMRILHHDAGLLLPSRSHPRHRFQLAPNTLPPPTEDFVGRVEEARRLTAAARQAGHPVLQVVGGMGGVGKTAFAVRTAQLLSDRYPDGQLYLNLRAHDRELGPLPPSDALRDLLSMLNVGQTGATPAEREQHWSDEMAGRRVVLVLDDVVGPDQVRPLIPEDADCMIIVTSRRRANWDADQTLTLEMLPEDDAIELFTNIAGMSMHTNRQRVVSAIGLCGRLPLAIRLAGTRLRTGRAEDIDNLIRELGELNSGCGGPEDVEYQVRSAFELSYRRLPQSSQRFFRYLGISPCAHVTVQSASALTGVSPTDAERWLSALNDCYLIDEKSPGCFIFHDLVRSYARALARSDDSESQIGQATRRLADYYLRETRRASEVLLVHGQGPGVGTNPKAIRLPDTPDTSHAFSRARTWMESEYGNVLRVAEHCSRHERMGQCVSLIHSVSHFLETSGQWDHAVRAHATAFRASQDADDKHGMARAAYHLSVMYLRTGLPDDALASATEAANAYEQMRDWNGLAAATDRKGVVCRHTARFRAALAYHQEAIDIFRSTGDEKGAAKAMLHAAAALYMLGRHTEETGYLTEALGIFRKHGDLRGQGLVHNSLGIIQFGQGYYRHAETSFRESYDIFRRLGGRQNLALLEQNMARIQQYRGRLSEALAMYRKALAEFRAIGDLRSQSFALINIGSVYQENDCYTDAIVHHEQAAAAAGKVSDSYAKGLALCGIADARRESGSLEAAITTYEHATHMAAEIEAPYLKAKALHGMAEAVLRTQGAEAARIHWRESLDIYTQIEAYEAQTVAIRLQVFAQRAA